MTDILDYIAYFRQLASEHIDIHDFYIMDINEPVMSFKGDMQFPAMILNSLAGGVYASNSDNTLDEIKGGFLIIDNLSQIDDYATEMSTLQRMKQIATDIIARMLYDKNKCEPRVVKAILGFDPDSVGYEMMGPLFDNCYGFNFTFKIDTTIDLEYHSEKWDPLKVLTRIGIV